LHVLHMNVSTTECRGLDTTTLPAVRSPGVDCDLLHYIARGGREGGRELQIREVQSMYASMHAEIYANIVKLNAYIE
jgi:hypothetical protein